MKKKHKVKTRQTLHKRIAAAPSIAEKRHLALTGKSLPSVYDYLAERWCTLRYLRQLKKTVAPDEKAELVVVINHVGRSLEKDTLNFAIRAMVHNQPDDLMRLAGAMKRLQSDKGFEPDRDVLLLYRHAEHGPVNLARVAKTLVGAKPEEPPTSQVGKHRKWVTEKARWEASFTAKVAKLGKLARQLKIPTIARGRPKNT